MSNQECKTCGRKDKGHWIGCAEALAAMKPIGWMTEWADGIQPMGEAAAGQCAYDDCTDPRRSTDKRVKFCELHSDPKNRK